MVDDFMLNHSDRIEIELSKRKIIFLLIASAAFVVFGCLGAIKPENLISPIFRNPEFIKILGIVSICFFGVIVIFLTRKLFDNKPGLIIDQNGITDNSNATSVGLITWDDITGIEKIQVLSSKILIIHTCRPDKYINRARNRLSKLAMNMNYKIYGSPISIISKSLKMNFDDLEKMVTSEFERRKKF